MSPYSIDAFCWAKKTLTGLYEANPKDNTVKKGHQLLKDHIRKVTSNSEQINALGAHPDIQVL